MKVKLDASSAPAFYGALAAPFGKVIVVVLDGGLARILLGPYALEAARAAFPDLRRDDLACADALALVERALAGKPARLSFEGSGASAFQAAVWTAVSRIPFGRVASYAQVARAVGSPRGARAVGGAMSGNPLPVVVPCHRVVKATGCLGGFAGGLALKARMLHSEGVALARETVDPRAFVKRLDARCERGYSRNVQRAHSSNG